MEKKGRGRKAVPFGGDWTETKLRVLGEYLSAYTTALKNTPFRKMYIDAFAGTGYREESQDDEKRQGVLLRELAAKDTRALLEGSAPLALRTDPPFDGYLFIEKSGARCKALDALRTEFPKLAARIDIEHGDANEVIRRRCAETWRSRRAVLFLDPFGMQVEWRTVESIAKTRAIDLWYLFPAGAVIRLLGPGAEVPPKWQAALDRTLPEGWSDHLYRPPSGQTLFPLEDKVPATIDAIAKYVQQSLDDLFAGVADRPAVLRNSKGAPLYLLCFAASNDRGARIAVRIANALLKGLS